MNPDVDSGQDSQEANDLASQEPSQISDDSKPDSLAGAELAQAAKDDPVASEELRRHFQSKKDIGVADAQKTAKEALSMVGELADYLNLKPEAIREAQRNMVLDRLIDSNLPADSQPVVSEQLGAEAKATESSIDYIEAYEKAGVKQPDTLEELTWMEQFKDEASLKNALLKRKLQKPAEKTTSPSTLVSPSGGKGSKPANTAEIQASINAILGSRDVMLPENRDKLKELRAQLEEVEE